LLHGDVLAGEDVALAAPSLLHGEDRAARDVLHVDDAEPAVEVDRRALVHELDDLRDGLARLPEARAEDQAGMDRYERDPGLLGDGERLLLGRDLAAEVVRVRLRVRARLVPARRRRVGVPDRAGRARVDELLDTGARRRLDHVPRAVDARPDDVALR